MLTETENMERGAVIARIKAALKARSGKAWSVTGGKGTAYGWLHISAPPARCRFTWDGLEPAQGETGHCPSLAERLELGKLLGRTEPIHPQGESVAASHAHYREYIDRAEGRTPRAIAQAYWD